MRNASCMTTRSNENEHKLEKKKFEREKSRLLQQNKYSASVKLHACTHIQVKLSYLVGGHVADRAVGLDCFQLVQTPVQLLHGFHSQLLVGLICQQTHGHIIRTQRIHIHTGAPWHHTRRSKCPRVAWSYRGLARRTSGRCSGRGGGVYTELLHLVTLHHLRKFREVVLSDKLRLELLFADSLSVASFSPFPLFPLALVRSANPLPLCLVPPPLLKLSLVRLSPSQYHSTKRVACKLGGLQPPTVDMLWPPPPSI